MIPFTRKELLQLGAEALHREAGSSAAALYHKAFSEFGALCFWSTNEMPSPRLSDVLDAVSRLKREGNMSSRRLAVQLEEACLADI